jgi:hypothetical protein
MDPDFDITLNSAEESSSDLAKGHFLDSLGLGERSLMGGLVGSRDESLEEDGVILSSLPDDLGFPMRSAAPDRGVAAYATPLTGERAEVAAISLPLEDDPQPEPEQISNTEPETETVPVRDLDESLHLQCPECRGSLVLNRRHIGVEGACVWCHTPIVAAESARDGQVRIFPILGHVAAAPVIEETTPAGEAPAPEAESKSLPIESPETPQGSVEIPPATLPVPEAQVEITAAPVAFSGFGDQLPSPAQEELPSSFSGFGFGFSAPPASVGSATTEVTPLADAVTTTPDLDSLYETGGFLAAHDAPGLAVGFGEALAEPANTPSPAPSAAATLAVEEPIPGFGAFLQAPLGAPAPAPSPGKSDIKVEEPTPAADFLTPTPWGPPAPIPAPVAVKPDAPELAGIPIQDEAPAELPIGFASGFGSPAAPTQEDPTPPSSEAAFGSAKEMPTEPTPSASPTAASGFGEGFLSAGFATAGSSALFGTATTPESASAADAALSFQASTAVKAQEEVKAIEDSRSFAAPFHAFSTGSSSDEEPGVAKSLFGDPSPASTLWEVGNPSDEAPTPFVPVDEPSSLQMGEPLFGADDAETANPFADQTIVPSPALYRDFRATEPDEAPLDFAAAAVTEAPAPAGPPALPATEMTAATAPAATPQVVSQPLGNKPKPKVRKGFIVLMVVIVGFASGAALASFVLPVDEYVSAARAFMESKFNTGAATPRMPAMPEDLAMPTEPAAPADAQP